MPLARIHLVPRDNELYYDVKGKSIQHGSGTRGRAAGEGRKRAESKHSLSKYEKLIIVKS